MTWIDLTPDLTDEGQQRVNVGEVLIFDYEGSKTALKITRKFKGKVWAKEVQLFRPDEVEITDETVVFTEDRMATSRKKTIEEWQRAKAAQKKQFGND